MISQTAEYALRAVVALADSDGRPQTTHQIADVTKVPVNYLSKVLQSLNRVGLINSQRGLGGGSTLTRPATEISVLEVVNAVDPIARIKKCPLGLSAHGANLCPLHRRLDNAAAALETEFRETSIADLLSEPNSSRPLCSLPGQKEGARASLQIQTKR